MPDTKITALTAISTVDPAIDVLPIVDVSDTTMAASGTTKKITSNQILGAGGTATLASATITGDLTVDTNVLKVDSANNRVGIGTASPSHTLQVLGTSGSVADICGSAVAGQQTLLRLRTATANTNGLLIQGNVSNDEIFINNFYNAAILFGVSNTEQMRLNSTGLGVGGSPVTSHLISAQGPIAVGGTAGGTRTSYISNSAAASIYYTDGGASYPFDNFGNLIIQPRTSAARSVVIATGSTTPVERAVVKSTGQVRFVPLAADPSGAESGDVYYNSSSNKLKCYNGTTWNDLF